MRRLLDLGVAPLCTLERRERLGEEVIGGVLTFGRLDEGDCPLRCQVGVDELDECGAAARPCGRGRTHRAIRCR